ncbi:MAG TPA: YqzM family protein [Pseudogracilibacillus sp.]|nr:YqzM family protein [Pseudogracilibacillus sp.]
MNEFEKDPQEKTNDIPHAATGFIVPFVFFSLIFAIGSAISFIHS